MCEVPAHNRWCLTGTPIQNSLDDFGSLLAFIGVPPFQTRDQFKYWISAPLLKNQTHSLRLLRKLILATCLRRTKSHSALSAVLNLPEKVENYQEVHLTEKERELYDFFKRHSYLVVSQSVQLPSDSKSKRKPNPRMAASAGTVSSGAKRGQVGNTITLISILRRICDHGEVLLPESALQVWQTGKNDIIKWNIFKSAATLERTCCVCGFNALSEMDEQVESELSELSCKVHFSCDGCVTSTDDSVPMCPNCPAITDATSSDAAVDGIGESFEFSSKVEALLQNIMPTFQSVTSVKNANAPVKRYGYSYVEVMRSNWISSVIFSTWTRMLDMISRALLPKLSPLELYTTRIDGQSTLQQRRDALDRFNADPSCIIMLATIGAVGEGYVNLSFRAWRQL